MNPVLDYFRTLPKRQMVRPWALAVPVLVFVVALPMLRPLRNPDLYDASPNELSRLAAVQSLAENHTQEIDGGNQFLQALESKPQSPTPEVVRVRGGGRRDTYYSDKSPTLAVILAGFYLILQRFGLSFGHDAPLVTYLLTVF